MLAERSSDARTGGRTGSRLLVAAAAMVTALGLGAVPATAHPATASVRSAGPVTYFFVPSLHSRPFRLAPGPDGNLWFTDSQSDLIGKITPTGQITEYDIGAGKYPYDIVAGRDGNMWFTEELNDKIGAVDTNGNLVHEYYSPGVDSRPRGIAVGPNGDVYWADGGSGQDVTDDVGRLLPDGTVVQYQIGPYVGFPTGIATGPDGNLWVAEELGPDPATGDSPGTLDRVTPDGTAIDRYPIPAPPFTEQHLPAWVAAGPDHRVWFTEFEAQIHQIGAVTHGGVITEYQIPGQITSTGSITTGFEGDLWVTEPDANRIAVVRPDGSFVRDLGVHQEPMGIAMGPDGNMWFTNSLSGEIGRIQTARPGTASVLDIEPGFVPADRRAWLGATVLWVLEAPGVHRVRDATGLGLYDSGPRAPVSMLRYTFRGAGTYAYTDVRTGDKGSIGVPVDASATAAIGHPFTVTWAATVPQAGTVFDVQVRPPGSTSWLTWKTGTTGTSGSLVPTAPGTYEFQARVRASDGSGSTDWSPVRDVVVS